MPNLKQARSDIAVMRALIIFLLALQVLGIIACLASIVSDTTTNVKAISVIVIPFLLSVAQTMWNMHERHSDV